MAHRDILDYEGNKIGELILPDDTHEDEWERRLLSYKVQPPSDADIQKSKLRFSIRDRKVWAEEMLERFKERNIELGINGMQALWLHHRMRALDINFMGVPMTQDILNMSISGDIETACLSIIYSKADDGTMPFHWYTETTKAWLVAEMKAFLGWP